MDSIMDSTLRRVLSQGNSQQNMHYPPGIFTEHYNIVTKFLIDEVAKAFPTNRSILEIAKPFLRTKMIRVSGGLVEIPEDCRHMLMMQIFVKPNFSAECSFGEEATADQIENSRLEQKAKTREVDLVEQFEWNERIDHSYKGPTYKDPIACMFGAARADSDQKKRRPSYRIAPFDVSIVEVSYLIDPDEYQYGYTMNPDDTYYWDRSKTKESQWDDTASEYLFKGVNLLYSMYSRDTEQRDSAMLLKNLGLF